VLSSLRPLRSRNFALVWSSALVSNVGSWMQTVALGILITHRTHNPLWTGAVAAAAFVPIGTLSPVGGALADRLDRRHWLITTTVGEAVFAAALAVLVGLGHAPPWSLVVLAFLGGVAAAVGFPTYQAMVPDLVPPDDLVGAVSLSSAQFNMGRVVGPALTGAVLLVGSAAWVFAANAVSFGAVVVALAFVRLPARAPTPEAEPILRRIAHGARVAAAEPGCRSAIVLIGIVALIGSPFIALVPAMAIDGFGRGTGDVVVLVIAQGVGAVCGALVLAPLAARLGRRLVVGALLAFPLALLAYGAVPAFWEAALAIALVGGCYIGVLTGLNTVVQRRAPAASRGRVLGLYMMALGLIYSIGAVAQGAIAHTLGIRPVTAVDGALLLAVMGVLALTRSPLLASLDMPSPQAVTVPGQARLEVALEAAVPGPPVTAPEA